jgi:carbon-monoxide dehydrogenase medium subunit
MKPAAFEYFAPRTVDHALDLLAEHGEEGKILAGGQSLVPAMNFRLARPAGLIDINRIAALDYVREEGGELCIGALARHARFEAPAAGGALAAFLPRVAHHIAHVPIRSRGTFCGSVAHADPASEWCLVAATLDAEMIVASRRAARTLRPDAYFVSALTTALAPDELLTEIRLPLLDAGWRDGFAEFSRRAGDYAAGDVGCLPADRRRPGHRRASRRRRRRGPPVPYRSGRCSADRQRWRGGYPR